MTLTKKIDDISRRIPPILCIASSPLFLEKWRIDAKAFFCPPPILIISRFGTREVRMRDKFPSGSLYDLARIPHTYAKHAALQKKCVYLAQFIASASDLANRAKVLCAYPRSFVRSLGVASNSCHTSFRNMCLNILY